MAKLSYHERKTLSQYSKAFALPKERKYPIYILKNGKLIPSRSHAINAKARATQMVNRGILSRAKKEKIDKAANRILKLARH